MFSSTSGIDLFMGAFEFETENLYFNQGYTDNFTLCFWFHIGYDSYDHENN